MMVNRRSDDEVERMGKSWRLTRMEMCDIGCIVGVIGDCMRHWMDRSDEWKKEAVECGTQGRKN